MTATIAKQADRAEDRFMARLNLKKFGINMDAQPFRELLADTMSTQFRAIPNVDELLVRPKFALQYCDYIRTALFEHGEVEAIDLPDDVILRTLLGMRKRG